MVSYARNRCADVEFSAEDATRSDREFLAKVVTAAIKAGAGTVNIPDTVGYTTPAEMMILSSICATMLRTSTRRSSLCIVMTIWVWLRPTLWQE